MKQRNRKLALLCIATALFAAAKTTNVEAHEKNQQELEKNIDDIHTGVATAAIDAAFSAAEQEVEKLHTAEQSGELLQEEENKELAVAQVESYINVRNFPGMEGEIIGKLHNNSVGEIIEEAGEWLKITSGNVEGYIKAEYALRGEEGAAKAEEVGERLAKVEAVTLRLREEATTESETLNLLPQEEVLPVEEETEGWVRVTAGETAGYVSADYVEVYTVYQEAESKEEEERRLAEEAARAAAEAAEAEQARQNAYQAEASRNTKSASAPAGSAAGQKPSGGQAEAQKPQASSGLGRKIADYALQFVGNPYVYGGTSLTNGADCSGFVMSVYQHFGISLPRTSGEQGQCGTNVGGIGNAVAGDLVSYSGHIGIYIGNGQIVHASSARTGIKVSNASYRPILSVRRIV